MQKRIKGHAIRIIIAAVIIGLIGIFLLFRDRMSNSLNETTESYLKSNVDALAKTFFTKLDDQMVMLESQTRYFKDVDLTDYNAMKRTIISTKGIGAFNSIGVASSTGATMDYNGKSAGNILLQDYFKEAMEGENAISDPTGSEEGEELVLAVPIKKDTEVAGIVYGSFSAEVLNSLVDSVRFSTNAANILVSENGDIIAKTDDTPLISKDTSNLFEEIPGLTINEGQKDFMYKYQKNNKGNIIVLTSVGVHDWYFATVIPEELVTEQSRRIEHYVVLVIVEVSIIFILIMFALYILGKKTKRVERANERLKTVSEQSGDIIIDYDYSTRKLTLEGDTSLIIPEKKEYYDDEDIKVIFDRINDEDNEIRNDIEKIALYKQKQFKREGRLWCTDECYRWFQLNITIVSDSEGKPTRLIGSIENIDERVKIEQTLARKANTDLLTGLTNKVTFESDVKQIMKEIGEDCALALFIIDLDNFKAVNDNLGHVVGDRVLTDVSKKLKLLFPGEHSLGRIGGDEFSAYMIIKDSGNRSENLIKIKAEQICNNIRSSYSSTSSSELIEIGCSIGIAFYPKDAKNFRSLYIKADQALYVSKESGKGIHTIWTPDIQDGKAESDWEVAK